MAVTQSFPRRSGLAVRETWGVGVFLLVLTLTPTGSQTLASPAFITAITVTTWLLWLSGLVARALDLGQRKPPE